MRMPCSSIYIKYLASLCSVNSGHLFHTGRRYSFHSNIKFGKYFIISFHVIALFSVQILFIEADHLKYTHHKIRSTEMDVNILIIRGFWADQMLTQV